MERITLKQTEGRGRNGWFRAREVLILTREGCIDLDVVSSRPALPGPVRLELSRGDAVALGHGLLRSVAGTPLGTEAETLKKLVSLSGGSQLATRRQ